MSLKKNKANSSFEDDDQDNFRTARVNLDLDLNDRTLTPEQIASLFIEISQRAEKCFDFQISAWLTKYEALRQHPNFQEAALLISAASQIYARKVNYFEDMVLQLAGGAKGQPNTKETETDQTKVVRRRGKKFRMNTIADSFGEAEFIVKEFEQLPSVKLTEIIKKKKVDFDSHWEKFKASQCRFLKNKKNKLVVSKKMTTDNSEIIATNATFGKNHIFDYDGEEIVGTKSDFRCFSNILNDNCELITDYNFTKYFQHVDLVNQEEEKRQQGLPIKSLIGARRFKFYISSEYLKKNYGIEVKSTNMQEENIGDNPEITKDLSLEQNISEFSDMINTNVQISDETLEKDNIMNASAKSIVSCDSAYQSMASSKNLSANQSLETIPEVDESGQDGDEVFYDAMDTQENMQIDNELTKYNLTQKQLQEGGLPVVRDPDNNSLDEGISLRSPSIQSPIIMSETGSEINLDMIYQSRCLTTFQHIQNNLELFPNGEENGISYENCFNKSNLFWIDPIYLEHQEDFEIPFNYLMKPTPLEINILKLPEQKVRRRCLFALPPEEYKSRLTYIKLPVEPPTPRVFKTQLFKISDLIDQVKDPMTKDNADTSDGEEFRGFEEELLSEFNKNIIDITTSTPNKKQSNDEIGTDRKRKAEDLLEDAPSEKRISLDSNCDPEGLLTDDEDSPVTKEPTKGDENLTTPERIRRAALARISQDSGVISPEPGTEETLIVTIPEGTNEQISIEVRRDTEDTESLNSFASAVEDPHLLILSNHDKQLAEQAQQKYQQQVSDMQTLVEKVNRWHNYLKPILKASQERSEFDIHACGTEVLETFNEDSGQNEATFADVMSTKPGDHLARYFLATLMLVNTGNLEMTNLNTDVDRISEYSEIQLKIKSRVRLHEEIENMDATVPCISKNNNKKKGKRMADTIPCEIQKSKKAKQHTSRSLSDNS